MCSDDDTHRWVGCPIRISTDQRLLAAPRGFSQRATSFIASWCQGIHRMPFSRSTATPPEAETPDASRPCTETSHTPSPVLAGNGAQPSARASLTYTLHGAPERDTPFARSDRRKATPKKRTRTDSIAKEQRRDAQASAHTHAPISRSSSTTPHPAIHVAHPASRTGHPARAGAREPHARRMETIGFEPMTPCLQSRCSPS